jgi:hypothetical protein
MTSESAPGESLPSQSLSFPENPAIAAASETQAADRGSAGPAAGDRAEQLLELRDRLKALAEARRLNRLAAYRPYAKQREFHELGARYRKRLFSAGNQVGKTTSGAAETAMHLTGIYPSWWAGRRFDRPVTWIAGGVSGELVREGP